MDGNLHATQEGERWGENERVRSTGTEAPPMLGQCFLPQAWGLRNSPFMLALLPPEGGMPAFISVPPGPGTPRSPVLLKGSHVDMCFIIQNKLTGLILTKQAAMSLARFSPGVRSGSSEENIPRSY